MWTAPGGLLVSNLVKATALTGPMLGYSLTGLLLPSLLLTTARGTTGGLLVVVTAAAATETVGQAKHAGHICFLSDAGVAVTSVGTGVAVPATPVDAAEGVRAVVCLALLSLAGSVKVSGHKGQSLVGHFGVVHSTSIVTDKGCVNPVSYIETAPGGVTHR